MTRYLRAPPLATSPTTARVSEYVLKSGDTMTGRLIGPAGLDPVSDDEYARRAYVVPRVLFNAKGDLIAGVGLRDPQTLPVGLDEQTLICRSTDSRGLAWTDPAETWTGSALPTTNLRPGRRVYATNLSTTLFGPNAGRRLYVYDPQPRDTTIIPGTSVPYSDGPRGWRLVNPIKFHASMEITRLVGANLSQTEVVGIDFGLAPVQCDVEVHFGGCVELRTSPADKGEARIVLRRNTGEVLRRGCHFMDAGFEARPTINSHFHETRQVGDRIFYLLDLEADTDVRFAGTNLLFADAVTLTVVIT